MNEHLYTIECEECDNESHAVCLDKPKYCPICGRRAEIQKSTEEFPFYEDEYE